MSKSGSRYGRRSNWFKIHCLLQEQTGNSQGVGGLGAAAHFGAGFLPGLFPSLHSAQAQQQSLLYGAGAGGHGSAPGKPDARDQNSPSQEDIAIQSHLLHAGRGADKSPRPDDLSLQSQLKLLAWQKEEERASHQQQQQSQTTLRASPSSTSAGGSPPSFAYKDFATASAATSGASLEVFRPFLPVYTKRSTESPSESGASSGESGEELPLHERSANSSFGYGFSRTRHDQQQGSSEQLASSGASSERELPPRRRVNATVTLTATAEYLSASRAHHHHLLYPPAELVTPATSSPGHALRGGDLLLASPSPGGLAVEQCEPIDLSVRSSRLQRERERQQREAHRERENRSELNRACASGSDGRCSRSSEERDRSASPPSGRASAACSPEPASPVKPGNPLDLSLEVKRPAEVSL
ncbi:hypothetical protein QAD02_002029 [Eretmocerus hayati]|uniref:Uncharacterized protein n=1 Tax=Eretmocerus hayati TaxID=131215 RepID=A0ACC2NMI3_9HYME|nr:hypothetical protein QAD02_002029 [Eretmocerus hayati]